VADVLVALIVLRLGTSQGSRDFNMVGLTWLMGQMLFPKAYSDRMRLHDSQIWKVWRTHGQAGYLAEAALGHLAVLVVFA